MLIGSILFAAMNSAPALGASTGVICIIPAGASSCPSSPSSLTGTVGSQLRVSVFIQNSTGLNGFDVTLLADHAILKPAGADRSEEHTSELQSHHDLVCRLLLEKKKKKKYHINLRT